MKGGRLDEWTDGVWCAVGREPFWNKALVSSSVKDEIIGNLLSD